MITLITLIVCLISITNSYGQFHEVVGLLGKYYKCDSTYTIRHYPDVKVRLSLVKDTVRSVEMIMDFKQDNEVFINSVLNLYTIKSDSIFYDIEVTENMTYDKLVFVNDKSTMFVYHLNYFIIFVVCKDKDRPKYISLIYEIRQ